MAPEMEITAQQYYEVEKWLREKAARGIKPNVYVLEGEPIVLQAFNEWLDKASVYPTRKTRRLICSNKHVQELEQAGIIKQEAEVAES